MEARRPARVIQRRKVYEDVTSYLLDDIKNGVYPVGAELPSERALMAEFGVGRPAVREALSKLARMGLVEVRSGFRSRVCQATPIPLLEEMDETIKVALLSEERQHNMQEIRMLFEVAVGRFVVKTITPEQLAHIEQIHLESGKMLKEPQRLADLDVLFHRSIGEASNNQLIVTVFDAFSKWLIFQRLTNFTNPARPRISFEEHGRILESLKTGNPDEVEKAIQDHLRDVADTYWSIVNSRTSENIV
jgi:GntR family transcriptional repressor for pyruvate dehydrogenase complex